MKPTRQLRQLQTQQTRTRIAACYIAAVSISLVRTRSFSMAMARPWGTIERRQAGDVSEYWGLFATPVPCAEPTSPGTHTHNTTHPPHFLITWLCSCGRQVRRNTSTSSSRLPAERPGCPAAGAGAGAKSGAMSLLQASGDG